jgi:prevent-host-death family protein
LLRVKIAELKDQLSRYLRAVERGEEVEVTDRNRPIARIVPTGDGSPPLTLRPPTRPFASIRNRRYPAARWNVSSTDLLKEERQTAARAVGFRVHGVVGRARG